MAQTFDFAWLLLYVSLINDFYRALRTVDLNETQHRL